MSCYELSEENFHHCCRLLLQLSEQLEDGWSWETVTVRTSTITSPAAVSALWRQQLLPMCCSQGSEDGYLRKTELRSVALDSSLVWDHEELSSEEEPDTGCDWTPQQQELQEELVSTSNFLFFSFLVSLFNLASLCIQTGWYGEKLSNPNKATFMPNTIHVTI